MIRSPALKRTLQKMGSDTDLLKSSATDLRSGHRREIQRGLKAAGFDPGGMGRDVRSADAHGDPGLADVSGRSCDGVSGRGRQSLRRHSVRHPYSAAALMRAPGGSTPPAGSPAAAIPVIRGHLLQDTPSGRTNRLFQARPRSQ